MYFEPNWKQGWDKEIGFEVEMINQTISCIIDRDGKKHCRFWFFTPIHSFYHNYPFNVLNDYIDEFLKSLLGEGYEIDQEYNNFEYGRTYVYAKEKGS